MPRNYITPDLTKITVVRHFGDQTDRKGVVKKIDLKQYQIWAPAVDPNSKTGPYVLGYVGLDPGAPVTLVIHSTEEAEKKQISDAVAAFKGGKPTHLAQIPFPDDPDEEPDDEDEETDDDTEED